MPTHPYLLAAMVIAGFVSRVLVYEVHGV